MPQFVMQRELYEARERPSKAFSWKAFMLSNLVVEVPWNLVLAVLMFVSWYYPIGLQSNAEATDAVAERGALMFLFVFVYLVFASTFAISKFLFSFPHKSREPACSICLHASPESTLLHSW